MRSERKGYDEWDVTAGLYGEIGMLLGVITGHLEVGLAPNGKTGFELSFIHHCLKILLEKLKKPKLKLRTYNGKRFEDYLH